MKVNLEGRYTSTYGFVGRNNLERQAEKIFGKNWVAEDDLDQIQLLCNCISNEQYVVESIETRDDNDILVREVDNWDKLIKSGSQAYNTVQNKKQTIKTSIELLDDAYRIIMDLTKSHDDDYHDDVQDILSAIDDVQYKIETLFED
jgi:gas vesicle protein